MATSFAKFPTLNNSRLTINDCISASYISYVRSCKMYMNQDVPNQDEPRRNCKQIYDKKIQADT